MHSHFFGFNNQVIQASIIQKVYFYTHLILFDLNWLVYSTILRGFNESK